jgi:hypothetical protein
MTFSDVLAFCCARTIGPNSVISDHLRWDWLGDSFPAALAKHSLEPGIRTFGLTDTTGTVGHNGYHWNGWATWNLDPLATRISPHLSGSVSDESSQARV